MKRYPAILASLFNTPQVIQLEKLEQIAAFVAAREHTHPSGVKQEYNKEEHEHLEYCIDVATGETISTAQVPATQGNRQFVAVLPLFGTLFQHGDMAMDASGGTSTEQWQKQFAKLDANPSVKTIVIETHSPGGQVWGTQEAADVVRVARDSGRTRIVSVVNSQMASGAIWIGTAANQVFVTPGGEMGSIGVVAMHRDMSGAEAAEGVKTTLIAMPPKKVEGNEFAPLDEGAMAAYQDRIEQTYQRFVGAMAKNRGVSTARVQGDFGGGGMLKANEAVAAGLADGVATMQEVMDRELSRVKMAGRKSVRNTAALAGL